MWFSKFDDLNDPAELSKPEISAAPAGLDVEINKIVGSGGEHFVEVMNNLAHYNQNGILDKQKSGVCCFSETSCHQAMWAYYADNFQGMCIEYDAAKLLSLQSFCWGNRLEKVNYTHKRIISAVDTLNSNTNAGLVALTSKSPDWGHEKEWRAFQRDNFGKYFHSINAVTSVYLGARCKANNVQKVLIIAKKLGINVFQYRFEEYHMVKHLISSNSKIFFNKNVEVSDIFNRSYERALTEYNIDKLSLERAIDAAKAYTQVVSLGGILVSEKDNSLSIIISLKLNNGLEGLKTLRFDIKNNEISNEFYYG